MEKYEKIKKLLEEIKVRLDKIDDLELVELTKESPAIEGVVQEWSKDRIELWCRVYNEDGVVTQEKLHEIWQKMGKDTRGLGGFFSGKPASLSYTFDNKVSLTATAADNILSWTGKPIEEYAKKFK